MTEPWPGHLLRATCSPLTLVSVFVSHVQTDVNNSLIGDRLGISVFRFLSLTMQMHQQQQLVNSSSKHGSDVEL